MPTDPAYIQALGSLRAALASFGPSEATYREIVEPRDEVFARFQPVLSLEHMPHLTTEEFTPFLYFENNHHWSGLYRMGLQAAANISSLRAALTLLLDESKPIEYRFPVALSSARGLGKGIATAVLTVAYPDKYGVWNNTSEAGLREAGIWPAFDRGESLGHKFAKINELLKQLSTDLGVDLWTLDALWWHILEHGQLPTSGVFNEAPPSTESSAFALEKQLEEFLIENWQATPLAKDWVLYNTPEDPEAGNQYPTEIGRIDILARHKREPRYLVIELKRQQSTDQTVGQVLRYLGWVRKNLATSGEKVEALIISHKADKDALYALSVVPSVKLMTYEVQFNLHEADDLDS